MLQAAVDPLVSYVPPRVQNVVSQFAAAPVRAPEGNALNRTLGVDVGDMALRFAEGGLPLAGPVGYIAGVPFSFFVADKDAQAGLQKLTQTYRSEIAAHFHVPEAAVNEQMTLMAANQMPGIAQAVQAIYEKRDAHPWINGAGIAGMGTAALAAGTIASGGLLGIPLMLGAAFGGSMIGEHVGKHLFGDKDVLNPMTHIERIEEKRLEKQPIHASDIFALRVAQNAGLQQAITAQYGKSYFELDEGTQLQAMKQCEGLMRCCCLDAARCAQPEANVKQLMFGMLPDTPFTPLQRQGVYQPVGAAAETLQPLPAKATDWQQRVGGPQARPQSYAQMIRAQQAQAQTPQIA